MLQPAVLRQIFTLTIQPSVRVLLAKMAPQGLPKVIVRNFRGAFAWKLRLSPQGGAKIERFTSRA